MTYGGRVAPSLRRFPFVPPTRRSRALRIASLAAASAVAGGLLAGQAAAAPLALDLPAAAPSATNAGELAPYYTQVLTWTSCADLSCAWLTVPLDYAKPSGATIRLRVAKSPATGTASTRQGSLVINPGGPGGSGVDFTSYAAKSIAINVATQFDIVGFDPRGVAQSAPVTCMTGRQTTIWLTTDGSPDTMAAERRLMSRAAAIPRGCLRMSPTVARHVGTENTVRDMDILREVLGDQRLNWLGFSYGTYLGALYAEAFPDRVGRMVLDGALDPSLNSMQVSEGQSRGFQKAVARFAADCAERSTCAYQGGTQAVLAGINSLLAGLDRNPMPTTSSRVLTQAHAMTAVFYPMYSTSLWPILRRALVQTTRGDGSGMLALSDYASDRTGPNTYAGNMTSAFYAVSCWDMPQPPGIPGLRAAATAWSQNANVPELAISMAWGNAPCHYWYGHSARAPRPATSTTTAPIMVVGTTFDPATPYWWSVALSKQLQTSTLLTRRGDGHTAYGSGSSCIDNAVDAYLLRGSMPSAGTVCR